MVLPVLGAACESEAAAAMPSFEAGAKSAPVVGVLDASAMVAEDAGGCAVFDAQAASVPATKIPQYLVIDFLSATRGTRADYPGHDIATG
jgi:hypothetical protein